MYSNNLPEKSRTITDQLASLGRESEIGELDGKVAVVTGAGRLRGIGRAAAVAFARLGSDVVVTGTGRNPETFPRDWGYNVEIAFGGTLGKFNTPGPNQVPELGKD